MDGYSKHVYPLCYIEQAPLGDPVFVETPIVARTTETRKFGELLNKV
jgi:hypothetical protein